MTAPSIRRRPILAGGLLLGAILAGIGLTWVLLRALPQEDQACANCSSFIFRILESHAKTHEGWFPRGGRDEWDSLSRAIEEPDQVHFFTSHALQPSAGEYWAKTRSLSDEVSCYRYNEGLRLDDSVGLILMYYEKAGHWECMNHYMPDLGRVCLRLRLHGSHWEYLGEEEFRQAQELTEQVLRDRRSPR